MACNGKGVCALGSKLKTPISTFPVLARHEFSNPAITFPRLVVFLVAQWYGENMQKTFDNVWKKSVWKLVCLRSCRYSPDLQATSSTGSRIVHWRSHHVLSLAIKQFKFRNKQLWILQRRSDSMVTFKHAMVTSLNIFNLSPIHI